MVAVARAPVVCCRVKRTVQVDAADHQREQDGLRGPSVGEPLGGVGDVDAVALGPAAETFDVRSLGPVGVLPGGVEAVPVPAELVVLAQGAGRTVIVGF